MNEKKCNDGNEKVVIVPANEKKESSPDYCVKSKAIVFSFTFEYSLSIPFHFF